MMKNATENRNDGHTLMAEIVDIEYFSPEEAPFPLEKAKSILRKCTDEDLELPKNEADDAYHEQSVVTDSEQFKLITQYIEIINAVESFGEWVIDYENDGTPEHPQHMPFVHYNTFVGAFHEDIYKFSETHPEYQLTRYNEILEKKGIPWGVGQQRNA